MRWFCAGILISILLICACTQEKSEKKWGRAAPFSLYDTDSVLFSLKDYQNTPLMIHFWADWCPHCREEFPKLQQAYEKLKLHGFEILAINSGQSKEHVREIRETYQLTFPLLVDEEAKTAKNYNVSGLPSSYFVDGKGVIRDVYIGWLESEKVVEFFERLKNEDQ